MNLKFSYGVPTGSLLCTDQNKKLPVNLKDKNQKQVPPMFLMADPDYWGEQCMSKRKNPDA